MTNRLDQILIAITAIATLCVVPFFLRFEKQHDGWSSESADAIAKMSKTERDDLQANAKRLKDQLPDEKREAVELIHAAMADPEVAERLDAYHDWYQGLDVIERDSIRSAPTVERKVAEIQGLLADAEGRDDGFYVDTDSRWIRKSKGADFADTLKKEIAIALNGPTRFWISDHEYDKILSVLIDAFPAQMQRDYSAQMSKVKSSATESERFRARANAVGHAMSSYIRTNRRSPKVPAEVASKVIAELEESETREALLGLSEEQQLVLIDRMKMQSMMDEFRFIRRFSPSDEEAAEYFATLTRAEQIELMGASVTLQRIRLKLMWLVNSEETPDDIRELAGQKLEDIKESRRGRGGRGGREGRPGGRRGPGGERGGDRRDGSKRPQRPDGPGK